MRGNIMLDNADYKLMISEIDYFLKYSDTRSGLIDRLIVYKYRTLIKKVNLLLITEKDFTKKANIIRFFFPEGLIGFHLLYQLSRSDRKETRRITGLMKKENEIIKRKIEEVKDNDMYFEDENQLRSRLSDYMSEEFLEKFIDTYNGEPSLEKVNYHSKKKIKSYVNNGKCVIIDFNTRQRIS